MDDDRTTVRYVDRMIADAVARRASDIHLQPESERCRLRLRIDGLLREAAGPPPTLAERVGARIKLLAGMDVAERRRPQDGRLQLRLSDGTPAQFRVASCPSSHGEKLVLRLIEQHGPRALAQLGLSPAAAATFEEALRQPEGLILVTGPTGSGKSATLHAALQYLNTPERNLCTVEDPVEMSIPGITQVAVNRRAEIDFATVLRAFLRQDPDIIMVGEIRDTETAAIAVKAAQTGHLVLSTLHTRSAAGAIERLARMGIPPHDLASSLSLVIAQRLVRRRCPCQETPATTGASRQGCCDDGFAGRCGLFEALPICAPIQEAILAGASARAITEQAAALGYEDLASAGNRLIAEGLTTSAELRRATSVVLS
ncbi:hypothetical protein CKO15_03380 [Halorhodospira abdelmalekii]|uniref:GspE/PulE family protein n=1 Tax=Halorhodospira abdelmalekii TaxID=421629 RepID=UPI0019055FB0|nr:GspE/PulE family protein [Halorhodospira abdelmalekii]MBK1734340.1 hypothetical protein [Halorhodospira abdelmalekii]